MNSTFVLFSFFFAFLYVNKRHGCSYYCTAHLGYDIIIHGCQNKNLSTQLLPKRKENTRVRVYYNHMFVNGEEKKITIFRDAYHEQDNRFSSIRNGCINIEVHLTKHRRRSKFSFLDVLLKKSVLVF